MRDQIWHRYWSILWNIGKLV